MSETAGFVIAALIGSLASLITLFVGRRKLDAEVRKLDAEIGKLKADEAVQLTKTALDLLPALKERVAELEKASVAQTEALVELREVSAVQTGALVELGKKLERANGLIKVLLRGVTILMHQLQELGVTPWFIVPVVNGQDTIEELEKRLMAEVHDSEERR